MTLVRHRARMVRQSLVDDVTRVLEDTQWIGSPTLALLTEPVVFQQAFPEQSAEQGQNISPNTLVLDVGSADAPYDWELGGSRQAQEYTFTFFLYAESDAVGMALFQDLADRYLGRTEADSVILYDYATPTPIAITNMEVDSFRFNRSVDQEVGYGYELYLAQLIMTDYIDLD